MAMDPDLSFMRFRVLYTEMSHYVPISDGVTREILELAYQVQNGQNAEERGVAQQAYTKLILQHLANIDVVTLALSLSRQDRAFGDPELFSWLHGGLKKSILIAGDGSRLSDAYDVMTLGEETILLKELGVSVLSTQAGREGRVYYNMHEVEDPRDNQRYTVFVETSVPMSFLAEEEAKKPQSLDLRHSN